MGQDEIPENDEGEEEIPESDKGMGNEEILESSKGKGKEEISESSKEVSIEIVQVDDNLLASNMIACFPKQAFSDSYFIYRVPTIFRNKGDEKQYEPSVVSIGPYHHGKDHLKTMEEKKYHYLQDLITRSNFLDEESSFQGIVNAIRELEEKARACYSESISFNSDDFVRMMILDGCFLLELFYQGVGSSHKCNPTFGETWRVNKLLQDLELLENQLPFVVLNCLFNLTGDDPDCNHSLAQLVISFFTGIQADEIQDCDSLHAQHILDLIHHFYVRDMHRNCLEVPVFIQYSATDLFEAGVKLKAKTDTPYGKFDITFNDGVLAIPSICFDDTFTIRLKNFIAFEQCCGGYAKLITSYATLLDGLVNTKEDVKLLRGKGIINVARKEDELVAAEINSLCSKGAYVDHFYYTDLCSKLNAYRQTDWHKWRAILKHDYFNTPWATLSFVAAVVLLVLTSLQTLFSILSYYSS
ncbi:hypothetical protein AQUCO_06600025v1 [Aquilegia coerulea]|uniref:Uncharacterized protein n=1 Tax=Aquilegia coerulea TaxID=218851 RepID=A0A2G5CBZ7_AQUCA|nr:hypothetical protein AQUCO_06600025v1 [Aquilegia coerulea]